VKLLSGKNKINKISRRAPGSHSEDRGYFKILKIIGMIVKSSFFLVFMALYNFVQFFTDDMYIIDDAHIES